MVLKYDEFETAQAGIQMMLNKLPVFDCRTDLEQCIGLVLKDIKGIIQKRRIKQLEQVTKIENTIKTEHLSDLIILNPQWLAGVIGNLFGPQVRGFIKNGKLEKKVYPFLWPKFDPSLHQRIVDIMRCLGISFIDLETESFDIVPNCFSEDLDSEINSTWNGYLEQFSETISIIDQHDRSLQPTYKRIKWSYPFIPPGYFSRIIAQLSNYLQLELYSSNSVLMSTNGSKILIQLEGKENDCTLLIELVSPTPLIACTVFGNILHELQDFHQTFYPGLSFKFMYPCHFCCRKYFVEEEISNRIKSKFYSPSEFNEEEFKKEKNYNCSYHGSVLEIDLKSYVKEKGETNLQNNCFISFSFRLKEDNQLGLKVRDHLSKLTQTTPISCHYYVPRNDEALAIKNSKVFLFILSKNSITDAHCIRQINLAYHYQKLIFPLAVDPDLFGKLESGLAMILSRFQWTNWISKDPKDLESFKSDIITKIASSERNVVNENEIQDFDITFGKSLNEEYHSQALISYSHRDGEEFAKNVKEGLKSQGIKVWMDDQIRKGHLWRTEIAGNLLSSKVLIFIQTIESSQSPFCEEEVRFAHSKNKQVIVFDPKSIQVKFCSPQFEQIVKQSTIFQNQDSILSLIQCVQKIVNSEIDQ